MQAAKQLLITSGKAYRQKAWWKLGKDHLAAYEKDLVVWISGEDTVQTEMTKKAHGNGSQPLTLGFRW